MLGSKTFAMAAFIAYTIIVTNIAFFTAEHKFILIATGLVIVFNMVRGR